MRRIYHLITRLASFIIFTIRFIFLKEASRILIISPVAIVIFILVSNVVAVDIVGDAIAPRTSPDAGGR